MDKKRDSLTCPKCGGNMELDLKNLRAECRLCGHTELIVDIDKAIADKEATVRERERLQEETRQKKLELKYSDKKNKREHFGSNSKAVLIIICVIAVIGAAAYFYFSHSKTESAHVKNGDLKLPISSSEIEEENYNFSDLHNTFINCGFKNVIPEKIEDVKVGLLKKDGEIEKVTVNGRTSFKKGEWVDKDAEIVITYHTKKSKKSKNIFQATSDEIFCPNCEADLSKQKVGKKKFDPEDGVWICTKCGEVLYDEQIASTMEKYEGIVWVCDNCESILNKQRGFHDTCGTWVCTECGHKNDISDDAID